MEKRADTRSKPRVELSERKIKMIKLIKKNFRAIKILLYGIFFIFIFPIIIFAIVFRAELYDLVLYSFNFEKILHKDSIEMITRKTGITFPTNAVVIFSDHSRDVSVWSIFSSTSIELPPEDFFDTFINKNEDNYYNDKSLCNIKEEADIYGKSMKQEIINPKEIYFLQWKNRNYFFQGNLIISQTGNHFYILGPDHPYPSLTSEKNEETKEENLE